MELKPCPFCGKQPSVGFYESTDGNGLYSIECGWCEMAPTTPDFKAKKQAIKAWNTRADGWISVKDQMPGKEKFIMACNIRRIPDTLRIINPIFLTPAYTHWMPLPAPPDTGEEE